MSLSIEKSVSQSLKAASTFKELSQTALSLNRASDQLTKVVEKLENALRLLNLGVAGWADIVHWSDDNNLWCSDKIGYDKINGKWCIALMVAEGNYERPDQDTSSVWAFSDAPRELRIRAVEHIPKLIGTLNSLATQMTEKLIQKTDEVDMLASAINAMVDVPKIEKSIFAKPAGVK